MDSSTSRPVIVTDTTNSRADPGSSRVSDFARLRERTSGENRLPQSDTYWDRDREEPVYRTSGRPFSTTLDYGYEHSKPSDLARWDLNYKRPQPPAAWSG